MIADEFPRLRVLPSEESFDDPARMRAMVGNVLARRPEVVGVYSMGSGHGALRAGLDRVRQVGGAQPGDRAMIDALAPALDALEGGLAAAAASRQGADATARITRARAGRASYLPRENLSGHNDPGAEAVALLFERLNG